MKQWHRGSIRRAMRWCGCTVCEKRAGIPRRYVRVKAKRDVAQHLKETK